MGKVGKQEKKVLDGIELADIRKYDMPSLKGSYLLEDSN